MSAAPCSPARQPPTPEETLKRWLVHAYGYDARGTSTAVTGPRRWARRFVLPEPGGRDRARQVRMLSAWAQAIGRGEKFGPVCEGRRWNYRTAMREVEYAVAIIARRLEAGA